MRRLLLGLLVLAGCPDSKQGAGDTASVTSGVPASGKIQKKPHDPKADDPAPKAEEGFSREALAELYRGDLTGDRSAHRKYGLVDANGNEVPAKVAEYEAALERFSREHEDEWSKLVDELEAARVTSARATDVKKK